MSAQSLSGPDFRVGDWLVRPSLARIERADRTVHVTPRSMAVLAMLARARGRVVSRNEILDAIWPNMAVTQDVLSQCIVELRKAFGDDSKRAIVIETIPKVGLRLVAPVTLDVAERQPAGRTRTSLAARAVRLLSSPAAPVLAIAAAAAGVAAFWLAGPSSRPWRDPLSGAEFIRLTDFVGAEEHAAISPDGRFMAFVSDRDGAWDVWAGQIGTGDFRNLTKASIPELRNPFVRMLGFSPRGADVLIWSKTTDATGGVRDHGWTVPIVGGEPRPNVSDIAELDWSPDGSRIVYHPSAPGDPLFITSAEERSGGRKIHAGAPGVHCHFPVWSRDGETIYFVQGFVPDEMDVWRIRVSGGKAEQLTRHNSRVSFPTLLDERTLLYLATAADGSGPWLHVLDLQRLESRRLKTASNQYTSLATSADGKRIVASEAHPTASLWRASLHGATITAADIVQLPIHTQRGVSPRIGAGFIAYRAPKAGTDAVWKEVDGAAAREIWSGEDGRVVAGPTLAPDHDRLAFVVQRRGATQLYVVGADGSKAQRIASQLEVRGAPSWSPDGEWIAIAALREGEPRLFKISAAGNEPPVPLGEDYALDPAWSPSGEFLVYTTRDVGTTFRIKAVNANGSPHSLPLLYLNRGSRRLDFLGADESALVVLKGALSHKELWVVDLRSGAERALTNLDRGPMISDFDVSSDGRTVVFDRVREESDIVLIERAR